MNTLKSTVCFELVLIFRIFLRDVFRSRWRDSLGLVPIPILFSLGLAAEALVHVMTG